jgi:hypothetical protein
MHQYRILEREKQNKRLLESRLLLRAFQRLCEHWDLSRKEGFELLGLNSLHQLSSWQSNAADMLLTDAQIERLSFLLSIHQTLDQHLQVQTLLLKWLRDPQSLGALSLDSAQVPTIDTTPLELFRWANKQQLRYIAQQIIDAEPSALLLNTPAQLTANSSIRF